jgi:hypothetical protein
MKMTIKAISNSCDLTMYRDIGIGCVLVVRSFLSNFYNVEIKQTPALAKINGYLDSITKLKKWAIWIYFQFGTYRNSKPGITKLCVRA